MHKSQSKCKRRQPSPFPEVEEKSDRKPTRCNKSCSVVSANRSPSPERSVLSTRFTSTAPLPVSTNHLPTDVLAQVSAFALRLGVAPCTSIPVAVTSAPIPVVVSQTLSDGLSSALDSSSFAALRNVSDSRPLAQTLTPGAPLSQSPKVVY